MTGAKANGVTYRQGGGGLFNGAFSCSYNTACTYVNETLVQNIVGSWWIDGRENRCAFEEHLSPAAVPLAHRKSHAVWPGIETSYICGEQSGTWTYFSPSTAAFPFQNRSTNATC
jgi:hypothetical protein